MALRAGSVPSFVIYRGSDLTTPVYRVVRAASPATGDFLSYSQEGQDFRTEDYFRALGVSMWIDRGRAQAMARRRRFGTYVAEVDIRRNDIHWALTGNLEHHVTVWAPPAALLECIVESWAEGT